MTYKYASAAFLAVFACANGKPEAPADTQESCTEPSSWYTDADGDGYGSDAASIEACDAPGGAVATAGDCDDTNPGVSPAAAEVWYDGVDADCSGGSDYDQDGDAHDDTSGGGNDCDDGDASVYPGAVEIWYDGVDADCSGGSDFDQDGDAHDDPSGGGDDCDDADAEVSPDAEDVACNGVDDGVREDFCGIWFAGPGCTWSSKPRSTKNLMDPMMTVMGRSTRLGSRFRAAPGG